MIEEKKTIESRIDNFIKGIGEEDKRGKTDESEAPAEGEQDSNEDINKYYQELEEAPAKLTDIDFLLVFFFAILVDGLDIFEIFDVTVLPKLALIALDIITGLIIGGWIYLKTKKHTQGKKTFIDKVAKKSKRVAEVLAKQMAKRGTNMTIVRTLSTFVGEAIPFLGMIPFWTICVFETTRKKTFLQKLRDLF